MTRKIIVLELAVIFGMLFFLMVAAHAQTKDDCGYPYKICTAQIEGITYYGVGRSCDAEYTHFHFFGDAVGAVIYTDLQKAQKAEKDLDQLDKEACEAQRRFNLFYNAKWKELK